MGGGNPSTWPAAKPHPPSLAGAYSTNLRTVFLALVNYMDWVFAHPDPSLVQKAVVPGNNIYDLYVRAIRELAKRGWRDSPNPLEVDFLKVVRAPKKTGAFELGTVAVVSNPKRSPILNKTGKVVGYEGGGGPYAAMVTLSRGGATPYFRIVLWADVHPVGGIPSWERQLDGQS
jgi:hypothetical protein